MSDTPKAQRKEDQGTFFLKSKKNRDECFRAQSEDQMITRAMGGPLAEQDDASRFKRVLHIACGTGGWTIEAARRYPQMSLVGIDINTHALEFARENAVTAQVADRVTFQVMDALLPLDFPPASFDLVNLRLGMTFVRTWEWVKLLAEIQRVTRPQGRIRLTESEVIHQNKGLTSNPGLTRYYTALVRALYRSGHLFTEDSVGITAHLVPILTRFGYKDIQTQIYSVNAQAGMPDWRAYYNNALCVIPNARPFLIKWGGLRDDFDALYSQINEEMLKPDFFVSWNFLTVWGEVP